MRLKNIREVIHNSSQHSPESASVTVEFLELKTKSENDDDIISQFSIKRAVYKSDGTSKYFIDEQTVSKDEVTDLLLSKGVDLKNNRFLILQGEVEKISLMKPTSGKQDDPGLLEYLEDIIGSNTFIPPLIELESKIDNMYDSKERSMVSVSDCQNALDQMSENKDEAINYLRTMRESTKLNYLLKYYKLMELEDNIEKTELEKQQIEEESNLCKEKLKSIIVQHKAKFARAVELKNDIERKKKEVEDLRAQITKLNTIDKKQTSEIKTHIENKASIKNKIKEIEQEKNSLKDRLIKIQEELPSLLEQKERLEDQISTLREDKRNIINQKADQVARIQEKKETLNASIAPLERKITLGDQKLKTLKEELADILCNKDESERKLNDVRSKLEELEREIKADSLKLEEIENAASSVQNKETDIQNEIKIFKAKQGDIKEEYFSLKLAITSHNQNRMRGQQQSKIIRSLQSSPQLGAVWGRLGDLVSIDDRFATAVTAVGGSFNSVVVDTIETSQRCINYLKEKQIGSCKMMIYEKIKWIEEHMHRPFVVPPNSQRLFDLIKTKDNNVRICAYFILRNTLVCQDITIANKIAFGGAQRNKVVTMDGAIIHESGVMSGGGRIESSVIGNSISSGILNETDYMKATQKLENLQESLQMISNQISALEKESTNHKHESGNLPVLANKKRNEIKEMQKDATRLKELEIKYYNEFKAISSKSFGELEKSKNEQESELQKLINQLEEIKLKQQSCENEIGVVLGEDYIKVSTTLQKAEESNESLNDKIGSHETFIETSSDKFAQKSKEIAEEESNIKRSNDIINDLEQKKQKNEVDINLIMTNIAEKEKVLADKIDEEAEIRDKQSEVAIGLEVAKKEKNLLVEKKQNIDMLKHSFLKDKRKVEEEIENHQHSFNSLSPMYNIMIQLEEEEKAIKERGEAVGDTDVINKISKKTRGNEEELFQEIEFEQISLEYVRSLNFSQDDVKEHAQKIADMLVGLKGDIDLIERYKILFDNYTESLNKYYAILEDEGRIRSERDKIYMKRKAMFLDGFHFLQKSLKDVYVNITKSGDADLELYDTSDPFSKGVIYQVRPPGKSWRSMDRLSGGEKTLASLALIFALHRFKPTPLYFMDEIDAALDYQNVGIVGQHIKKETKNAQFIVISLRKQMYDYAEILVGIFKVHDISYSVQININQIAEQLKAIQAEKRQNSSSRSQNANSQKKPRGRSKRELSASKSKRIEMSIYKTGQKSQNPRILAPILEKFSDN